MSFCFGTRGKSGGHAVGITGVGACRPTEFKEPGPSIVPGSNRSALVIMGGTRRGPTQGTAEIVQGSGERLAYSPFNLGNTLHLTV